MEPRPIVILTAFYQPFASGAELCVEEMVKHREGRSLVIITSKLDSNNPSRGEDRGVPIIRVGFGYKWDKYLYPFLCLWPTLSLKPRIVHAVMESYAGIGLVLLKWIRPSLRTVLTLQSGNLDVDPKLSRGVLSWVWKKIHTVPDRVTAISLFLAKRAETIRGTANHIEVIPNGVDISVARNIRASDVERIAGRVVCISRLSREKGVDVLIKAFAKVAQTVSGSELHIVGDGPDRVFVENLIAENGLGTRVKLYGRQPHDEAIRIISTGQVFVLLSRGEGQGIVLLEAASAGLPCVATDVGGIPEAMIDGETGFLVVNEDAEGASVKISQLLQDPALRERMGRAGEAFAEGFEWTTCISKYHGLWESLAEPMRLVIATGIYPPDIGGPAGYVKRLAEALTVRGHEVTVVTYGDKSVIHEEPFTIRVVSRFGNLFFRLIGYAWEVWRSAKGCDLVYAQSPITDGAPAWLAARLRGARFAIKTVGDYAWEQYMNQKIDGVPESLESFVAHRHAGKIGLLESAERFIAKRSDSVISPSDYFKDRILSAWGVDAGRISVVRNGIEPMVAKDGYRMLNKDFPEGKKIIFTAGRAIALKRVDYLLSLLVDLPGYVMAVAGSGPCLESWLTKASEIGVTDRVNWLGNLDPEKMAYWYRTADVFALASSHETFPHVLIEAASQGLPCVASRVGGIPEIADIFPDRIVTLPSDDREAWLSALREAKRSSAIDLPSVFTSGHMVDKTESVLRNCVNI